MAFKSEDSFNLNICEIFEILVVTLLEAGRDSRDDCRDRTLVALLWHDATWSNITQQAQKSKPDLLTDLRTRLLYSDHTNSRPAADDDIPCLRLVLRLGYVADLTV